MEKFTQEDIWLVSVYYMNTDLVDSVPDYVPSLTELKAWCKSAESLVQSHLRKITFSYDVSPFPEAEQFSPEDFKLWRLEHNNPQNPSIPRCTPNFSSVQITPIIPPNIEFE